MTGNENYGRGGADYTSQGTSGTTEKIKDKARETASTVGDQVTARASEQKSRATESLGNVAQAIRKAGDELRQQEQGGIAHYTDEFAGQIDRLSNYLQHRSVGDLMRDVEGFARREPGLFLGAAFALGLLGSRFIKSSNPNRYEGRYGYGARRPQYGSYREGHYYPPTDYGYQYNTPNYRGEYRGEYGGEYRGEYGGGYRGENRGEFRGGYRGEFGGEDDFSYRREMADYQSTGQLETDIPAATNVGGTTGGMGTTGSTGTSGTMGRAGTIGNTMGTMGSSPESMGGTMARSTESTGATPPEERETKNEWRDDLKNKGGKL